MLTKAGFSACLQAGAVFTLTVSAALLFVPLPHGQETAWPGDNTG